MFQTYDEDLVLSHGTYHNRHRNKAYRISIIDSTDIFTECSQNFVTEAATETLYKISVSNILSDFVVVPKYGTYRQMLHMCILVRDQSRNIFEGMYYVNL